MENLEPLAQAARTAIAAAEDGATLEQLRVDYLGKKGHSTGLLKGLAHLSAEERPRAGALVNVVKQELQNLIGARKIALDKIAVTRKLEQETIDVTLSGRDQSAGGVHPLTRTIERMEDFFSSIGFEVVEGPEIEGDYYNFE